MPELPEIRAHAERLDVALRGRTCTAFTALSFTALKTAAPPPEAAEGHAVEHVGSRGKYLLIAFAPVTFVVHLMQGGRLQAETKPTARPRGGLARWTFDDGASVLLSEASKERRAGIWVVDHATPIDRVEPLQGLGPDADTLRLDELRSLLSGTSMRLHGLLRDQSTIAGIGRRLANEICHRARLSPFANAAKLGADESGRLHDAVASCIDESLAFERARSTMSSSKERPGAVHHRSGEPCPVCGDAIRSVEYVRYTVHYCATCQTGGRVLADNTTSKFLK